MDPSAKPTASSSSRDERDAHERTQAARLGGDRHDHGSIAHRDVVPVAVAAQLHDRNDAAVELEAEAGQRDRLHVADDLLRPLAGLGDHVHLGDAATRLRDDPRDRDVGQATDFPFHVGEVEIVHSDDRLAVRYQVDVFG